MLLDYVLILVLIVCALTDLLHRKLYNVVLMPSLLFALGYNLYYGGWTGLGQSMLGLLVGLLILILPFAKGGMGAGDVKLLGVIGAFKGVQFVLYTAIGMGLAGGLMALGIWFYRFGVIDTIVGIVKGVYLMITSRFTLFQFRLHNERNEKIMLPYGLAIALGAAGTLWLMR